MEYFCGVSLAIMLIIVLNSETTRPKFKNCTQKYKNIKPNSTVTDTPATFSD